ncbi:uncharacterized protein LOC126897556 isoform X2 [Daktulosphaira vitifoliae]|uniref:uncharacterized protein LOC126897556 isoform X2 n=1 Tax=Daktulosphaira vitifoliae TaxID=58002 RepID=UPI0021AA4814|nr:uncharacterized protein LOC126897556 isoform X2 [Daktulosphaira vitifoliae]
MATKRQISSNQSSESAFQQKPKFSSCWCGGGTYLGNIRALVVNECHKSEKCLKTQNKRIVYLSKTYFNKLKVFESVARDMVKKYEDRVLGLLSTWENCRCIFSNDPCIGTDVFMRQATLESASLVLEPQWEFITIDTKNDFLIVLGQILYSLQITNCQQDAIKSCQWLMTTINNPWSNNGLQKLLHVNPSLEEVVQYFNFENTGLFALRLRMLCESKCENQALKLSSLAMKLYNSQPLYKSLFGQTDIEFIRDIYFACLHRANKKEELINQLKQFTPKDDGKNLMDRYTKKIKSFLHFRQEAHKQPRICKHQIVVCEIAACILVATSLTHSKYLDDFTILINNWSTIFSILLKSKFKTELNNITLCDMIRNFINLAPTANHIYIMCEKLKQKFGSLLPLSFYVEIHVRALAANINEKEKYKQSNNKEKAFESLKNLVQGYLKLANLLENDFFLCRECILTAYSLMPSNDLLARIEKIAILSGKKFSEHQINVPENTCDKDEKGSYLNPKHNYYTFGFSNTNSKIIEADNSKMVNCELNNGDLRKSCSVTLSQPLYNDLIGVINNPRYESFNWSLEWLELKLLCNQYLEDLDLVLQRSTEYPNLTFLKFKTNSSDCSKTKNKKQDDIEKGYFFTSENSSDDLESVTSSSSTFNLYFNVDVDKQLDVFTRNRRNLRISRNYEETDDSAVDSLLNEDALNKNKLSDFERDDSLDSLLEEKINLNNKKVDKQKPTKRAKKEKRSRDKNKSKDFIYSWCSGKGNRSKNKHSLVKDALENSSVDSIKHIFNTVNNKQFDDKLKMHNTKNKSIDHSKKKYLNMLSNRIPHLNSLDYIMPSNTNHIVNVVQIQTSANSFSNVQQNESISNPQLNNETEKAENNDSQTETHSPNNFSSITESKSNPKVTDDEGETSFNSIKTENSSAQFEIEKSADTNSLKPMYKTNNLQTSSRNNTELQISNQRSSVENTTHLSTLDVPNVSNSAIQSTGQVNNSSKKTIYCLKAVDRFVDLSLPTTISSLPGNKNYNMAVTGCVSPIKIQKNISVQTSTAASHSGLSSSNIQSQLFTNLSINKAENLEISNPSTCVKQSKPSVSTLNPVSNIQTQPCAQQICSTNTVSSPNTSVISLMITSTQSQVLKANKSLYVVSTQNQEVQSPDKNQSFQIKVSDEQKKNDNMKLISQTFTATSEAIQFVTSNSESQRLLQCMEKNNQSNFTNSQNSTENSSKVTQEKEITPLLNNKRGNMKTYESKTKALKQANMSDMLIFEKGTLYAAQDESTGQVNTAKSTISTKLNNFSIKTQNKFQKDNMERPKLSPNASPNVTITGSMLPRFQQVFGKTKYQGPSNITDNSTLCVTNIQNSPSSSPVLVVNKVQTSAPRVYSSSKGVQTNRESEQCSTGNITGKIVESKIQHVNVTKPNNILTVGNNKSNVIMACKTSSPLKNILQQCSSNHQLHTAVIDSNTVMKKENTATSVTKVITSFATTSTNSSVESLTPNVVYTIPIQSGDLKANPTLVKPVQGFTQVQRQLKVSPSLIQSVVLRKHPNFQQNFIRQNKQNIEVQTISSTERLISVPNVVKTTTIDSTNDKSVGNSPNKTNVTEETMEQVREFESVLEEVRKKSLMNEMNTGNMIPQINHELLHSPTENVDLITTENNQTIFSSNKKNSGNNQRDFCTFSFLNQTLSNNLSTNDDKDSTVKTTPIIVVRSVTPTTIVSPNNNTNLKPIDGSSQCSKLITSKSKPIIKTSNNSPSTSSVKVPVLQKPMPKLQEDEQTTQRIYAILDKYAEQLRNSPELKNKPAPRRRTNPPTNPSPNAKRKKTSQLNLKTCSQQTSCSSSGMEMSPTSEQALDSEDSSNAVSQFSHIVESPSRNSEDQNTSSVVSESSLIENSLVNESSKLINVDTDSKQKVSQATQIVVSGTSGPFLSIPEGSAGNVRLLVASGKNAKMYRLHCPLAVGHGSPVLFHQITTKDASSNDIKITAANVLGQNLNESTLLSALTSDNAQSAKSINNELFLNTLQNSNHKISKSIDITSTLLSDKNQINIDSDKHLSFPVIKKSQASQSSFGVIHALQSKTKPEQIDNLIRSETQNTINSIGNVVNKTISISNQSLVSSNNQETVVKEELKMSAFHSSEANTSTSIVLKDVKFSTFHSQEMKKLNNCETSSSSNIKKLMDQSQSNLCIKNGDESLRNKELINNEKSVSKSLHIIKKENGSETNIDQINAAAAAAAKIISTANQSTDSYKHKEEIVSSKSIKEETHSLQENANEKCLSNTVYDVLNNQSVNINTKIGSLTFCLTNDRSAENWNNCLSKIMPPGTEKILEGDNLKKLQSLFLNAKIKTFKDLKNFILEQCKKFDNNIEPTKEYDLYDDIDDLGFDKPSASELFPDVAILNDLDKSVSPTYNLLQATTSKSNDLNISQTKRKSVLSHTTNSNMCTTDNHLVVNNGGKKSKPKVSFLKQALYNEMNQDSNDYETKPSLNGNKLKIEMTEHNDLCPESPSNINIADSETCMSEDSSSTISSGTPHYNFRKSKRKNLEQDGFIESQVIKRMYRGRISEDANEPKTEPQKNGNINKLQSTEQKLSSEKIESRRISNRLKNSNTKNITSSKSPQSDNSPRKLITTTRSSQRRISRKTI